MVGTNTGTRLNMTDYQIPLARYEFNIRISRAFEQPDYAGSMLRGLFGHALRKIACVTEQNQCKTCERYRQCIYTEIFETPPPEQGHRLQKFSQIPAPYVIEPPKWGRKTFQYYDIFSFNMVLTGKALDNLPLIIFTWQEALKQGIAKEKGSGVIESIYFCPADEEKQIVFSEQDEVLKAHNPLLALPNFKKVKQMELMFVSPLRLQKKGHLLNEKDISARTLLISLSKRLNLVNEFHNNIQLLNDFQELSRWAEEIQMTENMYWIDWSRYSNRQRQKMKLGGLLGSITFKGNLSPFFPLLYLGQWLHFGKNATFGMGRYQLELVS